MTEYVDRTRGALAPDRPSRRTIARGAAWAVPVVAASGAAPALAASGGPCAGTGVTARAVCSPTFQGTNPQQGVFTISAQSLAVGQFITIVLDGPIASTSTTGDVTGSGTAFQLIGTGADASGTIRVTFDRLTGNGTATIHLTLPDCPDNNRLVSLTRAGNQYVCTYFF